MSNYSVTPPTHAFPMVRIAADADTALEAVRKDEILDLFREHGAVLLRGFTTSLDGFGAFARDFCPVPVFNESGKRIVLDGASGVQSVNLGNKPFPLHPELSREPWRPDAAFFYCATPPSSGGQTTICDGIEIVRQLPETMRAEMEGRRIRYAVPATAADLQYWLGATNPDDALLADPPAQCPFTFEWHGGQLMRCFTRPLLQPSRFQGELAWGNFILFTRYLRGVKTYPVMDDWSLVPDRWVEEVKRVSDRLTVPVGWHANDIVMLDNSRFMHGRTEIVPGDGRRIATYFGYLDGVAPDPEEPPAPPWRREGFMPPQLAMRAQ